MFGQTRMTTANAIATTPRSSGDLPDAGERLLAFLQMLFEVHVSRSFQFNFVDSSAAFCSSSSRAAVMCFLASFEAAPAESRSLGEALVEGDPATADVADRGLGLLARLPRLRRDAGLQPLEVGVPARSSASTAAAKVAQSSEASAASECSATSSLVFSCPSFSSTSSGPGGPRRGRLPPPGAARRGDA